MYNNIRKTFNLTTSIIGLLSIISLFILRDNIILLNKKDKNNDKKKLSGGNVDVDVDVDVNYDDVDDAATSAAAAAAINNINIDIENEDLDNSAATENIQIGDIFKSIAERVTDEIPVMENTEFWLSFSKIFGVVYAIFLYIFIFTTTLDFLATNIYSGVLFICPIFASIVTLAITIGVSTLTNRADRYINIGINFIVSLVLVALTIDRLLISSYSMGCIIENSNFNAIIDSTVNSDLKALWKEPETLEIKAEGAVATEGESPPSPETINKVKDLEHKLFKENYAGSSALWHNKCDAESERLVAEGNIDNKAYCYTADDLNNMRKQWNKGGNHKTQALFNTCMGMYFRQHSLLFGAITHPNFIGWDCAARYAFFINFLVFFGSIGYLIATDKEAGLKKLGSLINLESHKKAFKKLDK